MIDPPSPVEQPERPATTGRLWSQPQRTRLYATTKDHPRSRRATDVVLLVVCLVGFALFAQVSIPPSAFEAALIALAEAVPSFLDVVWRAGVGLMSLWAVLLVLASLVRWRLDILRDELLGLAAAIVLVELVDDVVGSGAASLWESLTATGPPADHVSARIALVTAATVVASPHVARPFRATSRWLVGFGVVSLVILDATTPSGALLGLLCGAAAAATVHLVLGSSGGRPSLSDVRRALEELGVETTSLTEGARQHAGVFVLDATDRTGAPLEVKVYGRDAWDTQLLAKTWRALWYRDADAPTLTRVQQAEHEAFVTLLAARRGVPVDEVVSAGRTTSNDAVLVLRTRGVPLDTDSVSADVLESTWDTVQRFGATGFAHGDLAPRRFRVDGGDVLIDGLAGVTVTPTDDQRRADLAQLLVSSAVIAGPEVAVETALRRLGPDGLAKVLPYLQVAAFGSALRGTLATVDLDLDALRTLAAETAGVDEPKLAQLRRVSTRSLVQAALLVAAAYFFISTLAGIDMQELADALRDASIAFLVVALLWGQVPRFAQAESTRAACPRSIPYGPVVLLQFAITFVNLAIPSTAARVAVSIRFFQRQGIPPASSVSIGVIDSVSGFIVQIFILVSVMVFGLGNVDLEIDRPSDLEQGALLRVLVIVIVVAVVAALLAMVVPPARRWVLDRIRPWIHEAIETVSSMRSPRRVARLLGANLAAEVLFATTLGIVLVAFGESLPLATLLVINESVALFAGLMPVPGGIGVTEGALVLGLSAAGIDEATAFGVAIAYRMCTFYLPPLWGAVAFRRLERNGYL